MGTRIVGNCPDKARGADRRRGRGQLASGPAQRPSLVRLQASATTNFLYVASDDEALGAVKYVEAEGL
jgi:hypothetical protein